MKRRHRLSRSRDFDAVYRKGRSVSTRYLTVYTFPREDPAEADGPRLGLAVSRKVGDAVTRNRLKRRLRARVGRARRATRARTPTTSSRPGPASPRRPSSTAAPGCGSRSREALGLARDGAEGEAAA